MVQIEDSIDGSGATRLRMRADFPSIDAVDARVAEILAGAGVTDDLFPLRIVLREALLNAVIHGSGKDPCRSVEVIVRSSNGEVEIAVQDEGPGFPTEHLPTGFEILGDGGRGIALMRIYADELAYEDGGRRVRFVKRFRQRSGGALRREAKAS